MGGDTLKYTETPNIPYAMEMDDEGRVLLSIRHHDGSLASTVLSVEQSTALGRSIVNGQWQRDSAARQARLMRQNQDDHAQHMYVGRGDL